MSELPGLQDPAAVGRRLRREPLSIPGPSTKTVSFDRTAIGRLIQHRDPFLLIDTIRAVDPVLGCLEGTRFLDPADPVFRGHFPGEPIYPGCLQIEMIGQLGLCCHHFHATQSTDIPHDATPRGYRGVQVHNAAFLSALRPGDTAILRARLLAVDTLAMTCAGQLLCGDRVCAVAVMEAYLVDGD